MIYFTGPKSILPCCETATINDVVEYCNKQTVLGVDTETEGLDFTCKKMIMFQIGTEEHQYIIDTRHVSIEPLREILENTNIIKIFHNAKFDYKFIKKWSNITCEGIYDTFLAEVVNNCGKKIGFGLKDLVKREFNIELNKKIRNKFIHLEGSPYTEAQIIYGAKDVEYLCKLRNIQIPKTIANKLENVVALENKAVLAFADIEYNGLDLNVKQWQNLDAINTRSADALAINLDQEVIEEAKLNKFICSHIQSDMFIPISKIRKINIKWTSPKQVLEVFKTIIPDLDDVNGKNIYKYRFMS